MVPLALWMLLGNEITKQLAFPLAYLFFAVPMGEFLIPKLQDITALITVDALRLTGVPVFLEGRYLTIPSGSFQVAEACSGIRYLIASLALGTLYAYFTYQSIYRRIAFITLAIIVPIIANGIRAYGIVMLADISDYKLAVGVDHIIYGWLFFGLVMMFLFWLGALFREKKITGIDDARKVVNKPRAIVSRLKLASITTVIIFLLLLGPMMAYFFDIQQTDKSITVHLPDHIGGWVRDDSFVSRDWFSPYAGATVNSEALYKQGASRIYLYISAFASQRQGNELIRINRKPFNVKKLRLVRYTPPDISALHGKLFQANRYYLSDGQNYIELWQWYLVNGKKIARPLMAKISELWARIVGGSAASYSISFAIVSGDNSPDADARMKNFYLGLQKQSGFISGW